MRPTLVNLMRDRKLEGWTVGNISDRKRLVDDRALHWLVLMLSGDVAEVDLDNFRIWFDASDAHRLAYRSLEQLWNELKPFRDRSEVFLARRWALTKARNKQVQKKLNKE